MEAQISDAELKIAINTFVWVHAPGRLTLGEAEELACDIFNRFERIKKKLEMDNIR